MSEHSRAKINPPVNPLWRQLLPHALVNSQEGLNKWPSVALGMPLILALFKGLTSLKEWKMPRIDTVISAPSQGAPLPTAFLRILEK